MCVCCAGTLTSASISSLSSPLPNGTSPTTGPASAPIAAQSLPPDVGALADAAAATLGAKGSHVLILSVTTVGGFCVIFLVLAAAVFCVMRRRRSKQKAYVVESKPSQAGMSGGGQGAGPGPSPHLTTPKGLRQAYAKAAGLYTGDKSACVHARCMHQVSICMLLG